MKRIDVADLDCIYLSYDEPQKEKFWIEIKNILIRYLRNILNF